MVQIQLITPAPARSNRAWRLIHGPLSTLIDSCIGRTRIMAKLDPSAGLPAIAIGAIRYNIKKAISRELPELPDAVETQLFLQGRTPWIYSWNLLNSNLPIRPGETLAIKVTANLKREFHRHGTITRLTFLCKVTTTEDIYHPNLSTTRI